MAVEPDRIKGTPRDLVNQTQLGGLGPHADQHDGSLHDPVWWNGQLVEYVKDVGTHDQGYDGNVRQVMIVTQAGEQQIVPETEILTEPRQPRPPLTTDRHRLRPLTRAEAPNEALATGPGGRKTGTRKKAKRAGGARRRGGARKKAAARTAESSESASASTE